MWHSMPVCPVPIHPPSIPHHSVLTPCLPLPLLPLHSSSRTVFMSVHPSLSPFLLQPSIPLVSHSSVNASLPTLSFPLSISHILLLSASSSAHPSRSLCRPLSPRNLSASLSCPPPFSQQPVQRPEHRAEGPLVPPPTPGKKWVDGATVSLTCSGHLCTHVWPFPPPATACHEGVGVRPGALYTPAPARCIGPFVWGGRRVSARGGPRGTPTHT